MTRAPRFALALLVDDIGYLAERFAIAGTPDDCVDQVERAGRAGADRLPLTAITPDPRRFIERWSTEVIPRCLAESPSSPTGGR